MLADAHILSLGHLWFDTWLFKDQAYKSIVRPTLEYGCTVWDPYRAYQKSWLEQVQRRAARFVTRTYTKEEGCVTKALKQLIGELANSQSGWTETDVQMCYQPGRYWYPLLYVQHQSSLKTRAPHPLKFHFSHPGTRTNTASGRELSLTGIACHLIDCSESSIFP